MLEDTSAWDGPGTERGTGPWIAFTRVFVGSLLLYEVIAGGWWKPGTLASGTNEDWIGANAGGDITRVAERAIDDGVYGWYATLLESAVLPYATEWSYLATAAQLLTAVALIIGLWTRPAAFFGVLYFLPVFHFGTIRTSPLFTVPIAFVFVANAARYYGLDAILATRSNAIGRATRAVNRPLPIPRRWYPELAAGLAVISAYYLISMPTAETSRILSIGLEMTILTALTAGGFLLVFRGARPVAVAADALRIFVGYRFLQEIFFRTDLGLPGWASADVQTEAFETMAAEHAAPIGALIETVILPTMSGWIVAFAVVQTAVGVALLVGWRTRFTGAVAIGYLSVLTVLGFVRLGPLLLASLIVATALGGRNASLDAVSGRKPEPLSMPAPSMNHSLVAPAALVLPIVVFAGVTIGIDPSADATPLALESLVMAGFVISAAAVAVLEATRPTGVRNRSEDGEPVGS